MQHGVALPHGKTEVVNGVVCAVGLKPEGIDFESLDGKPSTIFALVLSPKNVAGPHVQFLAGISQVLDEQGRRDLLACETVEQMSALLLGKDTKHS